MVSRFGTLEEKKVVENSFCSCSSSSSRPWAFEKKIPLSRFLFSFICVEAGAASSCSRLRREATEHWSQSQFCHYFECDDFLCLLLPLLVGEAGVASSRLLELLVTILCSSPLQTDLENKSGTNFHFLGTSLTFRESSCTTQINVNCCTTG